MAAQLQNFEEDILRNFYQRVVTLGPERWTRLTVNGCMKSGIDDVVEEEGLNPLVGNADYEEVIAGLMDGNHERDFIAVCLAIFVGSRFLGLYCIKSGIERLLDSQDDNTRHNVKNHIVNRIIYQWQRTFGYEPSRDVAKRAMRRLGIVIENLASRGTNPGRRLPRMYTEEIRAMPGRVFYGVVSRSLDEYVGTRDQLDLHRVINRVLSNDPAFEEYRDEITWGNHVANSIGREMRGHLG